MFEDPFFVVKQEVQTSLASVTQLYRRWQELSSARGGIGSAAEYQSTVSDLEKRVRGVEYDLQDLSDTISIVESNRLKFPIDDREIAARKRFIETTRDEVTRIKQSVAAGPSASGSSSSSSSSGGSGSGSGSIGAGGSGGAAPGSSVPLRAVSASAPTARNSKFAKLDQAVEQENSEFLNQQRQTQQTIIQSQDRDLDDLSRSVTTLGEIGNLLSKEIALQNELLTDLTSEVDVTHSRLKRVTRRLDKLIKATADGKSWCVIITLVIALIVLVVLVFTV